MSEAALDARVAPPSRRAPRLHPGWVVLAVAAVGMFMSGPGQSYSVAAFIDPMLSDLGLLRTDYSMAYGVATLLGGLALPFIGRLIDRHGARRMLPIIALLLGAACLWMARVESLLALYIGFGMIRCLGQGSLTLACTWLVGEWFVRRRGLAMGLLGLGGTFSVLCFPQFNTVFIGAFGWQAAWVVLAIAIWIVLVIPSVLLVRNRPTDLGLLPDGHVPEPETDDDEGGNRNATRAAQLADELRRESFTVAQACRTSAFWKLLTALCVGSMVGTGLVFHQVSLLGERGVSASGALALLGAQAMVGTVVSIVAGYLTDRIEARHIMACGMTVFAGSIVLVLFLPSPAVAVVYAGMLGVHGGIMRSTGTVVWVNFFGRLHQGAVRGVVMAFTIAAAALGPIPLAISKDYWGSYDLALGGFLILPILAAMMVWSARQPTKDCSPTEDDTDTPSPQKERAPSSERWRSIEGMAARKRTIAASQQDESSICAIQATAETPAECGPPPDSPLPLK